MQSTDLIVTSRHRRLSPEEARTKRLVKIAPAVHVPLGRLGVDAPPWVARRRVAEARLLSLPHRLRRGAVFELTGESALVALGLDTWWSNPDVAIRRDNHEGSVLTFEGVPLPRGTVGPVQVWGTSSKPSLREGLLLAENPSLVLPSGVPIVPPALLVVDLYRSCHPLQAFHDTSVLLRYSSKFDRRDLLGSRGVENHIRQSLLRDLSRLGRVKGISGARALIQSADAGLESPAESAVFRALKCILPRSVEVRTQQPCDVGSSTFYMDVALPQFKVAFEATGVGKFGDTATEARHVGSRFVQRQQALADRGWNFVHVTYEQTKRPVRLVQYLQEKLAGFGVPTHAPSGPLWALPTPLLFHGSRKF